MRNGLSELKNSAVGWIAAQLKGFEASFDVELLSLPGGSVIAILLLIYFAARMSIGARRHETRFHG